MNGNNEIEAIKDRVRKKFLRLLLTEQQLGSLGDEDSFSKKGVIDSAAVVELISFIENEFALKMENKDFIPANLDSIEGIASFINRRTGTP